MVKNTVPPLTTQDALLHALGCVQAAHGCLQGSHIVNAGICAQNLAEAAATLLAIIKADLGKVA